MELYNGFYLGICLQNNDPEKRGRIKVFVPHISSNLYDKVNKVPADQLFKFPGRENNPDLANIIEDLKASLPWAEYAGPPFGGSASGRYNAVTDVGTTSDSNYWEEDITPVLEEGPRPLRNFVNENAIPDAFLDSDKGKNKFANQYAWQYTPSDYSNLARGVFSIPNVGAHIWVWFREGDSNYPVYFAVSYGQEDFKRIYTMNQDVADNVSVDYPAAYENISTAEGASLDGNAKTFRAKHVINSNKHTIEMVDTDLREILKLTHFSGSFLEFSNFATIELASNNDQKMVMGDQFLTVKKNQSIYVAQCQDVIVASDQYITVGEAKSNSDDLQEYIGYLKELHEYHRLFDVQRAQFGELPGGNVSIHQVRSGVTQLGMGDGEFFNQGFRVCPVCFNIPYQPIEGLIPQELTVEEGVAVFTPIEPPEVPLIGQQGVYKGLRCDVCNSEAYDSNYVWPHFIGYSPSTFLGYWNFEPWKKNYPNNSQFAQMVLNYQTKLDELAKKFGTGGDQIVDITKNKVETIGMAINDLPSFRTDPIGKLRIDGCYVATEATYETYKPSPHIEHVYMPDFPGGDYNCTAGNRYKLLVGSKGINIKTTGPIEIAGAITNITGEQINIGSKNEVSIDGGERYFLRARKIAFTPYDHNPVVVDGQLHVTRNVIIRGGSMQDGELGVLHITAPTQWYETTTEIFSEEGGMLVYPGATVDGTEVILELPTHLHYFENLPLNLLSSQQAVRDYMIGLGINKNDTIVAADIVTGPGAGYDENVEGDMEPYIDRAVELYITLFEGTKDQIYNLRRNPIPWVSTIGIEPVNADKTKGIVKYIFHYSGIDRDDKKVNVIASAEYNYEDGCFPEIFVRANGEHHSYRTDTYRGSC